MDLKIPHESECVFKKLSDPKPDHRKYMASFCSENIQIKDMFGTGETETPVIV